MWLKAVELRDRHPRPGRPADRDCRQPLRVRSWRESRTVRGSGHCRVRGGECRRTRHSHELRSESRGLSIDRDGGSGDAFGTLGRYCGEARFGRAVCLIRLSLRIVNWLQAFACSWARLGVGLARRCAAAGSRVGGPRVEGARWRLAGVRLWGPSGRGRAGWHCDCTMRGRYAELPFAGQCRRSLFC